jgi:cytidine deaminase
MTNEMPPEELIARAALAREYAYAPYSKYRVGAALLTSSGRVFLGANVENAVYSLTVCAERSAVFKAVSDGEQEFEAIAVYTSNGGGPCGACRQVLREFAPDLPVYIADVDGNYREATVAELLPDSFGPEFLEGDEDIE